MKNLFITIFSIALAACGSSPPPKPEPEPAVNAREANELALKSFNAGRYREAIGGFERAGHLFLSIDDQHGIAVAAISKAEIQLLLGEPDRARQTLLRARNAIGHNTHLRERARLIDARTYIGSDPGTARALLRELDDAVPAVAAQARMLLCELAVDEGETACISNLAAEDALASARIEQLRARAAMMAGDDAAAVAHLDRALSIYQVLAHRPGIAAAHEDRATIAERAGNRGASIGHLERALYLRLWIRDRTHSIEDLARLVALADDVETRERYLRWRSILLDDEGPEWEALIAEIFNSR